LFDLVYNEVMKLLQSAKGSHDADHTLRVLNMARHIGKVEKADMRVVEYAALLHDIGREAETRSKGKLDHAEVGSRMAAEILTKYQFEASFIRHVAECIRTHRARSDKAPSSLEAKVVYDADTLDAMGAVGIARSFVFAGEIGARVHNSDVDIFKTESYTKEDTAYREYMVKLRHLKDKLYTEEGRRIGLERSRFMDVFFERLNKEVEGLL
jgi:uncharacterized protein